MCLRRYCHVAGATHTQADTHYFPQNRVDMDTENGPSLLLSPRTFPGTIWDDYQTNIIPGNTLVS